GFAKIMAGFKVGGQLEAVLYGIRGVFQDFLEHPEVINSPIGSLTGEDDVVKAFDNCGGVFALFGATDEEKHEIFVAGEKFHSFQHGLFGEVGISGFQFLFGDADKKFLGFGGITAEEAKLGDAKAGLGVG